MNTRRFFQWLCAGWLSFSSVVMMVLMLAELSTTFGGTISATIIALTIIATLGIGSTFNKG